jgi:hypothetical protein
MGSYNRGFTAGVVRWSKNGLPVVLFVTINPKNLSLGCPPVAVKAAAPKRVRRKQSNSPTKLFKVLLLWAAIVGAVGGALQTQYTFTLQSPLKVHLQWPVVMAPRLSTEQSGEAQADQFGHRLTAFQQYACNKFGSSCRIALAVQRAENPRGDCEIYHYNTDGTLDWGYFQINTVHLKRAGVNLRGLLDCKANIDFAYQLYTERGFEPWSTYKNGAYLRFLRSF